MKLNDYQKASRKTAIYPDLGAKLVYPTLGLAGESGELLEKALNKAPMADFQGELGDVLWYTSQLVTELNLELEALIGKMLTPEVHRSQIVHMILTGYRQPDAFGGNAVYVSELCSELAVAVGHVSECTKKMIRDDNAVLTDERRAKYSNLLASVLAAWSAITICSGLEAEACAEANYQKLVSRLERGVLSGSGDNR